MKRITSLAVILILILATSQIFPGDIPDNEKAANEACYKSLLSGISSDNRGLQSGCTFMLGEVRCDKGVIPLLGILHNDKREEARILAALSLYKIGDSRGIFAIKQAIRFDDSKRVRRLCKIFYNAYLLKQENPTTSDIALE
jgi:HEAT repeat protein